VRVDSEWDKQASCVQYAAAGISSYSIEPEGCEMKYRKDVIISTVFRIPVVLKDAAPKVLIINYTSTAM